jgi:uncharacterized protein YehS (DUF1456 family)
VNNNDTLRRIRYALNFSDQQMVRVFGLGGETVSEAQVVQYLSREDDPDGDYCDDAVLGRFLDGLIIERRGPPPAGRPAPPPMRALTNNAKLKKLRVALNLHEDDMLATLKAGGHPMSRGELTALFRKPQHKHYRDCGDQVLRKFLNGLTKRMRPNDTMSDSE